MTASVPHIRGRGDMGPETLCTRGVNGPPSTPAQEYIRLYSPISATLTSWFQPGPEISRALFTVSAPFEGNLVLTYSLRLYLGGVSVQTPEFSLVGKSPVLVDGGDIPLEGPTSYTIGIPVEDLPGNVATARVVIFLRTPEGESLAETETTYTLYRDLAAEPGTKVAAWGSPQVVDFRTSAPEFFQEGAQATEVQVGSSLKMRRGRLLDPKLR